MKIRSYTLFIISIYSIIIVHSLPASAQNTTTLPTSMYGIGELSASDGGRYSGMGSVGIALNRPGFQNTLNPAAITRMDTACFTMDMGLFLSYARYSFLSNHSESTEGNPNRISLGFRVLPRWYALVGVAPYSSVGYVIQSEEPVEGLPGTPMYSLFEGEGGLYRLYLTNAFALTRRLSVGVNIGMVSGKTTQSESQEGAQIAYESTKRAFYVDMGLHYAFSRMGGYTLEAGAVFSPSIMMNHNNELTYVNSSTGENMDKSYRTRKQYLPMRIGAGITATTTRWTLTADYNYLDWSRNTSTYSSMKYENQHKLNVGAAYLTNPRRPRSIELMGGAGFGNSYINLKEGRMNYLEMSLGACFPIHYSYLSLGATWRKQLNARSNLMQENRWSLNLNLTYGEKISKYKIK